MKNLSNQLIAFFLLLCFAVTIVPLNTFHKHSHTHAEETHCDINDKIHSDDGCHFSLYHNKLEEKHCEHNAHITDNELECDFCNILNSKRDDDSFLKENNKQAQRLFSLLIALNLEHHQQSFFNLVFNKGPPTNI